MKDVLLKNFASLLIYLINQSEVTDLFDYFYMYRKICVVLRFLSATYTYTANKIVMRKVIISGYYDKIENGHFQTTKPQSHIR